jgi:hypothetical protein
MVTTASVWQPSRFDVVHIGNASVSVDSVGQYAGTIVLAPMAGDDAQLVINSGWLKVDDEVVIGGSSGLARLTLSGGELFAPQLSLGPAGDFHLTGGALHVDDVYFDLANQGGTIQPGSQPGEATGITMIHGDYQQSADGALQVHLAGSTPGSAHDQLIVAGTASLSGALQIESAFGYAEPTLRGEINEYVLLVAQQFNGTFGDIQFDADPLGFAANYVGAGLGDQDGLFRIVSTTDSTIRLINYLALPGDANGDMIVDGLDFVIWNSHKFTPGTDWTTGDFNGDGITDGQDFVIWNGHKFTSVGMIASVPEPSCGVLALLAAFGFVHLVAEVARGSRSRQK